MHLLRTSVVLGAIALLQACSSVATGKLGESCTRRADCGSGLFCINQTCVSGEPAAASLGKRGETCTANTDCDSGLACIPVVTGSDVVTIGRCDFENFNLKPTGSTCWAECKVDADCCEIPVPSQGIYKSCADLKYALGSTLSNCDSAGLAANLGQACFLYKAYCDCATSNPWKCTSGTCNYNAGCSASGETFKGCPVNTRTHAIATGSTCTNGSCNPSAATSYCTDDQSCVGKGVSDDSDTCQAGECTCLSNKCLRKCNNELDCRVGYSCDTTTTHVCVATGECSTDQYCTKIKNDVTAKCVNKKCQIPCSKDVDCSFSGSYLAGSTYSTFNGTVCSGGYCTELGCSNDAECPYLDASNPVKMFCVATPTAPSAAQLESAITD